LAVLSGAQVGALTTDAVFALSTDQLSSLTSVQVAAVTTVQVPTLSTDQVVALTTGQIKALSTAAIAALTTDQVVALETRDLAALTTKQIKALTTEALETITTEQLGAMGTVQIGALTTSQAYALTTDQVVALTTAQIKALTTAALVSLTTNQLMAIETQDIKELTGSQIQALSTNQVAALTTDQMEAMTCEQFALFRVSQIGAFTADQLPHVKFGTPIILDLDGNGVQTLNVSEGVMFDLFADGATINTGWVSRGDGLLVMDRNHDGRINDGAELFGSATRLANGQRASDGYGALRELDSNGDGVVDAQDGAFADLRVWVDANSDGVSGQGEMRTLASLGITSINAQAVVELSQDNGNLIGLTSSYETTDGATHAAADVWFVADRNQHTRAAPVANIAPPTERATLVENTALPIIDPSDPNSLRAKVSGLALAISTFDDATYYSPATQSAPGLGASATVALVQPAYLPAAAGMVDAMKQFDAHGQLLAPAAALAAPPIASVQKSLDVPALAQTGNTGFLAGNGG
jgi:Ca2+-binding EF-hand superfamily protein